MPTKPIRTASGSHGIDELAVGDLVLSRDEFAPESASELKLVEEVFVREGLVWELRLAGRTIVTTAEHPFFVPDRGWTEANRLTVGERLLLEDGSTAAVEGIRDTGEWRRVYNVRIADHNTYCVGSDDWGWSVWAHNACWHEAQEAIGSVRRKQGPSDVTHKSQADARTDALKRHGAAQDSPVETVPVYGKNKNLKGPNGEPHEQLKVLNDKGELVTIDHHSNGHYFRDVNQHDLPHYHGPRGEHISYE